MARGERAPDRLAADRPARGEAVAARRQPAAARLRARDRRELRHRRRARRGAEPGRRSSSRTRASTTSGCGPTCCGRRRWRSTSSATSPPTPRSPTGPSTPGGRTRRAWCRGPLRALARALRSRVPQQPPRVRRGVRARPRRRDEGDRRRRHEVPRAGPSPRSRSRATCARYLEVAERSGAFRRGATDALEERSDSAVMWLEHLLLLSMLQHPSGAWSVGPVRRRPPRRQLGLSPRRATATEACSATSRRSPPSPSRSCSTRKLSTGRRPRPCATGTCLGGLELVTPEAKLQKTDHGLAPRTSRRRRDAGSGQRKSRKPFARPRPA